MGLAWDPGPGDDLVNGMAAGWEVAIDFVVNVEPEKDLLLALEQHLRSEPGVVTAVASLTDHGGRFTAGATVVLYIGDAGTALTLAQQLVRAGCQHAGIDTASLYEAVVRPAGQDPRLA